MKGHLLVLQNFNFLALNHGVMEADYLNHSTISGLESSDCEKDLSVSMVASIDAAGNLLLGKFLFHAHLNNTCAMEKHILIFYTSDDCFLLCFLLLLIFVRISSLK